MPHNPFCSYCGTKILVNEIITEVALLLTVDLIDSEGMFLDSLEQDKVRTLTLCKKPTCIKKYFGLYGDGLMSDSVGSGDTYTRYTYLLVRAVSSVLKEV